MAKEKTIVASSAARAMRRYGSNYTTQHNYSTADSLHTTLYVMQWYAAPDYMIYRLALIFDTSEIPAGANIISAIIQIKPEALGAVDKNWNIVIRDGQPTYPHNPVVVGDYLYSHYSGDGGSIAVSTITDLVWNDITMNTTGRGWIQLGAGAVTKLVLISSKDISSTAPTALESVHFLYSDVRIVITYSVAPTVTIQAPTNVNPTTVTANGNVTDTGGENCTVRGFKYGLTKTDTWDEHDDGDFGTGAFTEALTRLSANTTYFIQAYATNPQGTSYSTWYEFQTAAAGVIPTGTKLDICSDYSGYTYILNSAFADDGETYESYFVLSTDLAQKQGLHIYKRLEDIFSYFAKKESGTAKIYIKRDSETEWQYAGEISMAGDEDIIVKHLPSDNEDSSGDVDFLARHFLIKFVFENDFEFIGLITEAIPIGVR